jgi:hypothetical protein
MFQERIRVSFLVAVALAALIVLPDRLHAAGGDLDTSFGTGGKVTTDFSGGSDGASAVPLPDLTSTLLASFAVVLNPTREDI